MPQRDGSHRLLLLCRSIMSFCSVYSHICADARSSRRHGRISRLRAQNYNRQRHSFVSRHPWPRARRRCDCCVHQGGEAIDPSGNLLLMSSAAPRYVSAGTVHTSLRGIRGSVGRWFQGQTHRLQPLRMLQRGDPHRLLLLCRSIVSFCSANNRTCTDDGHGDTADAAGCIPCTAAASGDLSWHTIHGRLQGAYMAAALVGAAGRSNPQSHSPNLLHALAKQQEVMAVKWRSLRAHQSPVHLQRLKDGYVWTKCLQFCRCSLAIRPETK